MAAADDYPKLTLFATGGLHEARLALDEIDTFRHYRRLVAERAARADTADSHDPLKQAERRACLAELDALIAEADNAYGDT